MKKIREIVTLALAERKAAEIKVRQPLRELKIKDGKLKKEKELLDLVKEEVNIKKIVFDKKLKKEVELNTKITPGLKKEGQVREIIRHIQDMRKSLGLKPENQVLINCFGSLFLNKILKNNKKFILETTKSKDLKIKEIRHPLRQPADGGAEKEKFDLEKEIKVDKEKLWLGIKKI